MVLLVYRCALQFSSVVVVSGGFLTRLLSSPLDGSIPSVDSVDSNEGLFWLARAEVFPLPRNTTRDRAPLRGFGFSDER